MTDIADLHEIRCEWIADPGWWSLRLTCGQAAWSHPNSDPLADVQATARVMRAASQGEPFRTPHPAQKSIT